MYNLKDIITEDTLLSQNRHAREGEGVQHHLAPRRRVITTILFCLLPLLLGSIEASAQYLPDLIVKDIKVSLDPDEPSKLLILFADASGDERAFEQWWDSEKDRRISEGMRSNTEDIYPFSFTLFIDDNRVNVEGLDTKSYLPRSGRKVVVTPELGPFTSAGVPGRRLRSVRVEVEPLYFIDNDLSNNILEKQVRRIAATGNLVIDRIRIKDDCDEVSGGEWIFLIPVRQLGGAENQRAAVGIVDVDSGDDIRSPNTVIPLNSLDKDLPISVSIGVVDCDQDGPISLLVPLGVLWLPLNVATSVRSCGGEDLHELSGFNDSAGQLNVIFEPQEWLPADGNPVVKSATSHASSTFSEDCGPGAFTIDMHIESPAASAPNLSMD